MPQYLSPGVYVEEVPSAIRPIAGIGTSTAGFIGSMDRNLRLPVEHRNQSIATGDGTAKTFPLPSYPVWTKKVSFEIRIDGEVAEDASLSNKSAEKIAYVEFSSTVPAEGAEIAGDFVAYGARFMAPAAGEVKLCTSFSEFQKYFGDFSTTDGQRDLAHAVYGFFNNGGGRCYVARLDGTEVANQIGPVLENFELIDEIAIVAAPGMTDESVYSAIADHCEKTGDRFAIFDSEEEVETDDKLDLKLLAPGGAQLPRESASAAFYFPWIEVAADPATRLLEKQDRLCVPPNGHVAGIYARVDSERGVHKAPANEAVRGALDLKYQISKAQQAGLNPQGVNVIRSFRGGIRVWGARTLGGDANGEWKYVNVRRLFLFLCESIEEGTRWVVFEPNEPSLWARIIRNVSAFLNNVWRDGALFGATPEEAFYVKCDAETNPPEVREQGQVVTEIGVAVVRPAEFVIFRISQWTGGGS